MMNKIEFYTPESEVIPTGLRLKMGEIQVAYRACEHEFAYVFEFFGASGKDEEEAVLKRIIDTMCDQSYDHGAEWRMTNVELIPESRYSGPTWKVSFRIKDIY